MEWMASGPPPTSTRWPDMLRADSWIDSQNSQSIPVSGTGRNIEQVFDFQVDLPSTSVPRLPYYTARPPTADLLVGTQLLKEITNVHNP